MKDTLKEVVDDANHVVDGGGDAWWIGGRCAGGEQQREIGGDSLSWKAISIERR